MSLRRPLAVPPRRQGFFISHRPRLTTEGWPAGGQRTPLDAVEQFSGAGIPDRAQEGAHPGSLLAPHAEASPPGAPRKTRKAGLLFRLGRHCLFNGVARRGIDRREAQTRLFPGVQAAFDMNHLGNTGRDATLGCRG